PADAGAGMAAGMGRTAPRRPRAATAGPAPEASDEDPALATHAARLRALPRGSLALRHDALADLRTRIAELRARLARPPGGF
ncbi:MAG: hypothetical protein IAE87_16195, partial [Rhodobacteraceae bacterium]|nr:hypothetical protein [Paracoccaceae bacterium]